MSRRRIAWAWHVARICPTHEGLRFRVSRVGDEAPAPPLYLLPLSHPAYRESFELLLNEMTGGSVVEVESDDAWRVTRVSLSRESPPEPALVEPDRPKPRSGGAAAALEFTDYGC